MPPEAQDGAVIVAQTTPNPERGDPELTFVELTGLVSFLPNFVSRGLE